MELHKGIIKGFERPDDTGHGHLLIEDSKTKIVSRYRCYYELMTEGLNRIFKSGYLNQEIYIGDMMKMVL